MRYLAGVSLKSLMRSLIYDKLNDINDSSQQKPDDRLGVAVFVVNNTIYDFMRLASEYKTFYIDTIYVTWVSQTVLAIVYIDIKHVLCNNTPME
jgi:hypothetical protein